MVKLVQLFEAIDGEMLGGGAGIMVYVPSTGRILVQIRGEHPDDKDSGKYDFFGGTLEEGETAEECARREAKEEGDLDFPEDGLEELGAFSSTEGGDWDGEPYHVFVRFEKEEFPPKIDKDEVAKAGWIEPSKITDKNATNRVVKALQHDKLKSVQHNNLKEARENLSGLPDRVAEAFLNTTEQMYWYKPSSRQWIEVESAHTWEAIEEIGIPEPEDWEPGEDWEIIEAAVRKGWVRISYFTDRKVLHMTAANGNLLRQALVVVSQKYPVIKSMWYEVLSPPTSEEYIFRNPQNPIDEF